MSPDLFRYLQQRYLHQNLRSAIRSVLTGGSCGWSVAEILTRDGGIHWKTLLAASGFSSVVIDFTGRVGRMSCGQIAQQLGLERAEARALTTKGTKVDEGKSAVPSWPSWLRALGGDWSVSDAAAQHGD